jgi:hypothetical protein
MIPFALDFIDFQVIEVTARRRKNSNEKESV